ARLAAVQSGRRKSRAQRVPGRPCIGELPTPVDCPAGPKIAIGPRDWELEIHNRAVASLKPPLTESQKRTGVPRQPDEKICLALATHHRAHAQFCSNKK